MKLLLLAMVLLDVRPATCTPDTAFWDTANKQLYRCTAPNTWTLIYTPKDVVPPVPLPIPPDPIPPDPIPVPPVNKPPSITLSFDPVIPSNGIITVKNQKILLKMSDDSGVVWTELYRNTQKVWEGDETTQKSYSWNTQPFKKKGPVTWRAITYDADGASATTEKTVTVR